MRLLVVGCEVEGRRVDVLVDGNRIADIGEHLHPLEVDETVDADGGALLPGLRDHHIHLHAAAAAARSVVCGPPQVVNERELRVALADVDALLPAGEWVRGVGYHESVAGALDRNILDFLMPHRPLRIQHRTGALWSLNSLALTRLEVDRHSSTTTESMNGVERDERGSATGRLWRADALLRRLSPASFPDVSVEADRLLSLGITGFTDATPDLDGETIAHIVTSVRDGLIPQRVLLLGVPDHWHGEDQVRRGPRKIVLDDRALPALDDLANSIRTSHDANRGVAIHCVTRDSLFLTLAALDVAGTHRDDRLEHAAVVPPEARPQMVNTGLAVVTQPGFVAERGVDYQREVAGEDLPWLYPYGSLLRSGVKVAPSSDAPYTDADPWKTIAHATSRRTRAGNVLGRFERVTARQALKGYLTPLESPGSRARRLRVGEPADMCLLHVPLDEALREPSRANVHVVVASSRVLFLT